MEDAIDLIRRRQLVVEPRVESVGRVVERIRNHERLAGVQRDERPRFPLLPRRRHRHDLNGPEPR